MHERECKGYISFNRGVNELNRGVNELNRGVNELNRGVNHSVARQGCNLLRAAVTPAATSQGRCRGNPQIHPLDLGHYKASHSWHILNVRYSLEGSEKLCFCLQLQSFAYLYMHFCSFASQCAICSHVLCKHSRA